MKKRKNIYLFIGLVLIILGVSIFLILNNKPKPEELTKEQACIASGGTVTTSMCCGQTTDFPNNCAIGACGCGPDSSHEVQVCNCGTDKCFDGNECVVG